MAKTVEKNMGNVVKFSDFKKNDGNIQAQIAKIPESPVIEAGNVTIFHNQPEVIIQQGIHRKLTEQEKKLISQASETKQRLENRGYSYRGPFLLPDCSIKRTSPSLKREGAIVPSDAFFDHMENNDFPPTIASIQRGVYLFDMGQRCTFINGIAFGFNDDKVMQDYMSNLRQNGRIQTFPNMDNSSRTYVSPYEIEREIIPGHAEKINDVVGKGVVEDSRYIELIAGNLMDPTLLNGALPVWFGIEQEGQPDIRFRIDTESNQYGNVVARWMDNRHPLVGFRTKIAYYY